MVPQSTESNEQNGHALGIPPQSVETVKQKGYASGMAPQSTEAGEQNEHALGKALQPNGDSTSLARKVRTTKTQTKTGDGL